MPSAIVEAAATTATAVTSPSNAQSSHARRASLKILNRNINQVVLGNLVFTTWYYSPYPDSVILGESHVPTNISAGSNARHSHDSAAGGHDKATNKVNGRVESAASSGSMSCQRLHVCPYCFRYTPKAGDYVRHLRSHSVTYDPHSTLHGLGDDVDRAKTENDTDVSDEDEEDEDKSTWPVPDTAVKVYEWDGYAVWDVDGEREKLYCQNLSLFGKLFLEQKSVFFDTGGFHYFVLTYTPPRSSAREEKETAKKVAAAAARSRRRTLSNSKKINEAEFSDAVAPMPPDINLHTRVLGFFSKENLSWDANNLACILVFPPYQHRNLGQLLMSISYKLSGWEWEDSIIGGPEKPLSAMGRRSYLRFWSERVARFMMGQSADADGKKVLTNVRKRKKAGYSKEEMTVKEIGDRTGMLAEDVIAALQEMDVMELVPPRKKKKKSDGGEEQGEEQLMSSMLISRRRVLDWAQRKGVDLVSPVKEEGFLGEWALSDVDEDSQDEEDAEEDESD